MFGLETVSLQLPQYENADGRFIDRRKDFYFPKQWQQNTQVFCNKCQNHVCIIKDEKNGLSLCQCCMNTVIKEEWCFNLCCKGGCVIMTEVGEGYIMCPRCWKITGTSSLPKTVHCDDGTTLKLQPLSGLWKTVE